MQDSDYRLGSSIAASTPTRMKRAANEMMADGLRLLDPKMPVPSSASALGKAATRRSGSQAPEYRTPRADQPWRALVTGHGAAEDTADAEPAALESAAAAGPS